MPTNHNLFEEKGEPKRNRTEVLSAYEPYRLTAGPTRLAIKRLGSGGGFHVELCVCVSVFYAFCRNRWFPLLTLDFVQLYDFSGSRQQLLYQIGVDGGHVCQEALPYYVD